MPKKENFFQDGPHLIAALVCEKLLEEKNGVKSVIRIVDRFTRVIKTGSDDPIEPLYRDLVIFLSFKKGEKGSKHKLRTEIVNPRDRRQSGPELEIMFEGGPERGIDLRLNAKFEFQMDGIYWVDVFLDEVRVTRIPLSVIFLTQRFPTAQDQERKPH